MNDGNAISTRHSVPPPHMPPPIQWNIILFLATQKEWLGIVYDWLPSKSCLGLLGVIVFVWYDIIALLAVFYLQYLLLIIRHQVTECTTYAVFIQTNQESVEVTFRCSYLGLDELCFELSEPIMVVIYVVFNVDCMRMMNSNNQAKSICGCFVIFFFLFSYKHHSRILQLKLTESLYLLVPI